ncbi:MAG: type IX secretion system membrane protein PorP/SprF [Bacteroidota bacterium]
MIRLNVIRIVLFIFLIVISPMNLYSQDSLLNPAGTWIYNPSWYNPAISGSKDYHSLDFTYATGDDFESMFLSGDTRLTNKVEGYYNMPDHITYRNIGLGYQVFHRSSDKFESSGFKATGSYHIQLNENSTSFLSIGLSLQGSRNTVTTIPDIEIPDSTITETTYDPNVDFGIYYYSPALYLGLSSTNILEGMLPNDTISYNHEIRHYHFMGGYKFVLYRPMNLLIEPSVIFSLSDSTFNDFANHIYPMVKIYIDNFCFGSYFYDWDKISVFFRYNYPGVYIGAFLAVSRKSPYYKKIPSIELSAGINLSYNKTRRYKRFHW